MFRYSNYILRCLEIRCVEEEPVINNNVMKTEIKNDELSKLAFDIYTMALGTNEIAPETEFKSGMLFGFVESLEAIRIYSEVNSVDLSSYFPEGLYPYSLMKEMNE